MQTAAILLIGYIVAQRVGELAWSNRNTRRLLADGAIEVGAGHYPILVLMHAAWLISLIVWLAFTDSDINWLWLIIFAGLQGGRLWVLLSLGRYWTTRIITMPGTPLVRRGPYRFLRHPNYLVVIGEIAVVPLIFNAWPIAVGFSVFNLLILRRRIAIEDTALAERRSARYSPADALED